MPGLSEYSETQVLNALLRGTNFVAPTVASLRLALFTADPTDAGNLNEVASGTWYTRKATGAWSAPSPNGSWQNCTNVASITFDAVTGSAVTVTHIGVYDALNAGNMLFSTAMTSPKTLQPGDVLSFAPGTVVCQID